MYLFSSLADAYRSTGNEEIVRVWINLFRAWIRQMPSDWNRLQTGIRLKGGWGDAFCGFIHSPSFDDDSLFLYLKATVEQALYLRENHSDTSNWLTFEMCGLYSVAVLLPEMKAANDWRDYVVKVAMADLEKGWLPDGVSIELTPGYGQFFSNYLQIADLAREVGTSTPDLDKLVEKTERLYTPYLEIMTPDGKAPAFQDNKPVDVRELMKAAFERFPERQDFRWAATLGREGVAPEYLSKVFPYAGYLVIRSGWEWNANYLCFDAGPVGYRHAHQDKLSLVMWAYGRQILFDPGRNNYADTPHQNYCVDTFSHSTGLVDNRPQRRKWYQDPNPEHGPFSKADDFQYEINDGSVWASGIYSNAYGRSGSVGTDSYPYKEGGNFNDRWGHPAAQFRQVAYVAPDIFVVQDQFVPNDRSTHSYEIRWQLDSVSVKTTGLQAATSERGKPNLAIIPLWTENLEIEAVSAQDKPEVMGWNVQEKSIASTTLRHMKKGKGRQSFLTLLLPLKPGQTADEDLRVERQAGNFILHIGDEREVEVIPAVDTKGRLTLKIKES